MKYSSFRVSWVTVKYGDSKYMAKAIMCEPERRATIQQLFEGLRLDVGQSEYQVTHGACLTKIDFKDDDAKDRLQEVIQRQ